MFARGLSVRKFDWNAKMGEDLTKLTIICPVYNEQNVIPLFFDRLHKVIQNLPPKYLTELLFLNNASTDYTYEVIEGLRLQHSFVYVVTLSSNVGYQNSLECGLNEARGDIFLIIDVDCEDPPEMIPEFIEHYEQGNDIVYGIRIDRVENRYIKFTRKLFYYFIRRVADDEIILHMAEFSLFTDEVREALIGGLGSFPFIRSSISRIGFNRIGIPYKRQRRIAGKTHYNIVGMLIFAVAGILTASTLPLRLPIYLFIPWILSVTIVGYSYIVYENAWLLLLELLLICAYSGATLGFIAIYVARIYKNTLNRQNYLIHRRYTHRQQ